MSYIQHSINSTCSTLLLGFTTNLSLMKTWEQGLVRVSPGTLGPVHAPHIGSVAVILLQFDVLTVISFFGNMGDKFLGIIARNFLSGTFQGGFKNIRLASSRVLWDWQPEQMVRLSARSRCHRVHDIFQEASNNISFIHYLSNFLWNNHTVRLLCKIIQLLN